MEPLFGRDGRCVAWLSDDVVYGVGGRALAFVRQGNVIDFAGRHLGVFDDGWIRDHGGHAVAFRAGAGSGPVKPVRSVAPVRPVRAVTPVRPVASVPPGQGRAKAKLVAALLPKLARASDLAAGEPGARGELALA